MNITDLTIPQFEAQPPSPVRKRQRRRIPMGPRKAAPVTTEPDQPDQPQPGDIVQIVTQDHPFIARIGIVHHLEGPRVICYLPGRKGQPARFRADMVDVQVVGRARLRFNKELPEESVYADNSLDKI